MAKSCWREPAESRGNPIESEGLPAGSRGSNCHGLPREYPMANDYGVPRTCQGKAHGNPPENSMMSIAAFLGGGP